MNLVSERYAEAFLEIAKEENKVLDYKLKAKELEILVNNELIHFFNAKKITKAEKKEVISDIFKEYPEMFLNLMYLLVDLNRISYLKDILKSFISKCNEALNIKEVKVYSARVLDEGDKHRIIEAIKLKTNSNVELIEIIDEALVAGIKINIDGKVIDTSLRNRLDTMKKELLKESW